MSNAIIHKLSEFVQPMGTVGATGGGGGGGVTSVGTADPITGGPITGTGTIGVATFGALQAGVVPASGGSMFDFLCADGTWHPPMVDVVVPTPTGTGFYHTTTSVMDPVSKLIDTNDINASQVTYAKIQNVGAGRILGNTAASPAGITEISAGAGIALSSGTIAVAVTPVSAGGAVALQAATPGTQQTGHVNLSGVGKFDGGVTALKSATTAVSISAATAPTAGQVLKATSATTATWQAIGAAGTVTLQGSTPGTPDAGHANITGTMVAGAFSGPLTGNVSGSATSAELVDISDDSVGHGVVMYPVWADSAGTGTKLLSISSPELTYFPSTGSFVAPVFTGPVTALKSATTSVDVAAATAPTAGQVLQAVDGVTATWQTLPAAGGAVALQGSTPGTPDTGNANISGTMIAAAFEGQLTGDVTGSATALKSATTDVNVSAATAPTNGQVLQATSGTTATWQTLTAAGAVTLQGSTPGTPDTGHINVTGTVIASAFSGPLTGNVTGNVSGSAGSATTEAITDDTTTAATMYPVWVTTASGNRPAKVSSTKLTFNPSTGSLSSTVFTGPVTALQSATTSIDVSAATAPSAGQVLKAVDSTHATWQAAGAGTVTSIATTAPITGGTITGTGTLGISIDTTNDGGAVAKQASTPGTVQTGHANVSGTITAGKFDGPATALKSASTTVDVAAAAAPTAGQVLTASSGTAAAWTTLGAGGAVTLQGSTPGTPDTGNANLTGTVIAGAFSGPLVGSVTGAVSALQSLTTSVDVSAATAPSANQILTATDSTHATWQALAVPITNDTTTNADMYPTWVTASSGSLPVKVSSSKLSFNPSTGALFATSFTGNASSSSYATEAGGIQAVDDVTTNSVMYPAFATSNPGIGGAVNIETSSTHLSYVPLTGMLTATGFTGPLTGLASTATLATNATNTAITNDATTNATMYPTWVTANTGNLPQKTSSTKLSFNPSTGMLTATGFTGPVTGLASTATLATNATNTTITNDTTTNATMYPTWVTATTGDLPQKTSSTKLTFNPSTGTLTTTAVVSALTGNATTATAAATETVVDDTTTNAVMYPAWYTTTTGNLPVKVSSSKLTFNPSTGMLTATGFTGNVTGSATALKSATTSVDVVAATAPTLNQVLTATDSTHATWQGGAFLQFVSSTVGTTFSATTTTAFAGAGSSYTFSAGALNVIGTLLHIQAFGVYTTDSTPGRTLAVGVRVGGTNVSLSTLPLETSAADRRWTAGSDVVVRTTGASGILAIIGALFGSSGSGGTLNTLAATTARTITKDLTGTIVIDFTGIFSAAGQSAAIDGVQIWVANARNTA